MSMSVSCSGCGLEYAGQRGLGGLLAGRRPRLIRRSRPAHYGARSLNFCSLPVAVLDELLLGGLLARPEHHRRLDRLAPPRVGYADHRDLRHGRVLVQAVLYLDRADVLAAGDDHVLLAVRDDQIVAGLAVPLVAGTDPAARQRRVRPPAAASSPRTRDWTGPGSRRPHPS